MHPSNHIFESSGIYNYKTGYFINNLKPAFGKLNTWEMYMTEFSQIFLSFI